MESLATEFGPYHCGGNITLSYYKACQGFGQFVGMFIAVMISDNISRKKAFLFCLFVCNFGMFLICIAQNMTTAVVGIFIIGLSNSPTTRIIQNIISETTQKNLKQKFISTMWISVSVGYFLLTVLYENIGHWRFSMLYSGLLPGITFLIVFYILI